MELELEILRIQEKNNNFFRSYLLSFLIFTHINRNQSICNISDKEEINAYFFDFQFRFIEPELYSKFY